LVGAVPARPRSKREARSDLRREDIVRQVAPIFLERGYDNVSINEIVHLVGGSKTTIYNLFGGKEGLMRAVVERITSEVTIGIDVPTEGALEDQLVLIGQSFLTRLLSPRVLAFHRLMVQIGRAFPEAGRLFFESGPRRATEIMAGWVGTQQRAGRIIAGDPMHLAQLYHDMLIGEHQLGWLTSYPGAAKPANVRRTVELAARVFVRGCAASDPGQTPQ
jgi:AcrR family transcriptional regulator